jgi:hypothetical protein
MSSFLECFVRKVNTWIYFLFLSALWDSFLELRIKLQRATITCNCLPTSTIVDDDELREVIDESKNEYFTM